MIALDCDWPALLAFLPRWQALSTVGRSAFLNDLPTRSSLGQHLAPGVEELVAAGIVEPLKTAPGRYRYTSDLRAIQVAMSALGRYTVFADQVQERLFQYIQGHLTPQEAGRLAGYDYYGGPEIVARRVVSASWSGGFLRCESGAEWERQVTRNRARTWGGWQPAVFAAAQELVRFVGTTAAPTPLSEVVAAFSGWKPKRLGEALHATCHDLLLYCALDGEQRVPVIGIHPLVVASLAVPAPPAPVTVTTAETFGRPFVIEDMVTLIAACSASPPRLKQHTQELYAREIREIASRLAPMPGWVVTTMRLTDDDRIEFALNGALTMDLVVQKGSRSKEPRLHATASGKHWLAKSPRERLLTVLQPLRAAMIGDGEHAGDYDEFFFGGFLAHDLLLPPDLEVSSAETQQLLTACRNTVAALPAAADGGFRIGEFIDHAVAGRDRRLDPAIRQDFLHADIGFSVDDPLLPEEYMIHHWRGLLTTFLGALLMPTGGIAFGLEGAGTNSDHNYLVSLTSIGRYLLGLADDFDLAAAPPGDVIVQPNFDVVFLGPSPAQEGRVGRVADRVGKGHAVGTLFRITRESILRAAAGGMPSEEILETLESAGHQPLPENVRREITGWLGRVRRLTWRRAVVVTCPDAESADRLAAAIGRRHANRLGATSVEVAITRLTAATRRKLAGEGLFLEEVKE